MRGDLKLIYYFLDIALTLSKSVSIFFPRSYVIKVSHNSKVGSVHQYIHRLSISPFILAINLFCVYKLILFKSICHLTARPFS